MRTSGTYALFTVIGLLLVGLPADVDARPGKLGPRFPPGLGEARLLQQHATELGVGEETLAKLEALVADIRSQDDALRQRMIARTHALSALLDQARPDEEALFAASAAVAQVGRETRELKLRCSLRVRALLSEKQLKAFMKLRSNAIEARKGRSGASRRRGAAERSPAGSR